MRTSDQRFFIAILALLAGLNCGLSMAAEDSRSADQTVVIDSLEWAIETNGENIKWPEAVQYCAELVLDGHSDWRLPTLDELKSLHDPDAEGGQGIRSPFVIEDCCLWSGESLVDRSAEDGDQIGGSPEMYHWGYMFDGGLPYYAVHIFDDGSALCVRDVESDPH